MIGQNEQKVNNNVDDARVRTITDKRKTLEDNSTKIRSEVSNCFEKLIKSLKTREKQLLRQLEAVHNQQLSIVQSNWELLPSVPSINVNLDNYQFLEENILKFGRLELPDNEGIVVKDAEPYKVEEYEEANKDHVSFDKSIKVESDDCIVVEVTSPSVGIKIHQFTNDNASSESPCSSSENFDAGLETETSLHLQLETESIGNENYSPLCSLQLAVPNGSIETQIDDECDHCLDSPDRNMNSSGDNDSSINSTEEKVPLKNSENSSTLDENDKIIELKSLEKKASDDKLENEKIDLSNDSKKQETDEHPKQIQQWLAQILVETETEPAIHEIEQFAEISKSRYKEFEFPLKT